MVPTISLSVEIAVHSGIQSTLIPLGRKVSQPRLPAPFWTVSVRVGINLTIERVHTRTSMSMSLVDDFFSRVIPAKLTEPTHVTLHLEDGSAPIKTTLVLRIDPEDDLVADFYCVEIGNTTGSAQIRLGKTAREMQAITVRFYGAGKTRDVKAMVQSISNFGAAKGRLIFMDGEVQIRDSKMKHAQFSIVDFPIFYGQQATYYVETTYSNFPNPGMSRTLGRSVIEVDGWIIIIAECADKDQFGVTHNGYIHRVDDSEFPLEEFKPLIDGLIYFFAFVTGVYRHPTTILGTGADGYAVWGRVIAFNQQKYVDDNWFSRFHGEALGALFPEFWSKFKVRNEAIRNIITSYAESSMIAHIGLYKNALTSSQSALETTARWKLGRDKKWEESAAAYIQEALCKLDISSDLSDYPALLKLWQSKYKKSSDKDDTGPIFITRLRNQIHPKLGEVDVSDYLEAWKLSQLYIELMLLRLCNYNGYYFNRATAALQTSGAQLVPWAPSAS